MLNSLLSLPMASIATTPAPPTSVVPEDGWISVSTRLLPLAIFSKVAGMVSSFDNSFPLLGLI